MRTNPTISQTTPAATIGQHCDAVVDARIRLALLWLEGHEHDCICVGCSRDRLTAVKRVGRELRKLCTLVEKDAA